jgi:hypothetical protein|tara:strand:- start:146 stop:247 length:102 start_codon:yes stop_codon:yes gene_type:complete
MKISQKDKGRRVVDIRGSDGASTVAQEKELDEI